MKKHPFVAVIVPIVACALTVAACITTQGVPAPDLAKELSDGGAFTFQANDAGGVPFLNSVEFQMSNGALVGVMRDSSGVYAVPLNSLSVRENVTVEFSNQSPSFGGKAMNLTRTAPGQFKGTMRATTPTGFQWSSTATMTKS